MLDDKRLECIQRGINTQRAALVWAQNRLAKAETIIGKTKQHRRQELIDEARQQLLQVADQLQAHAATMSEGL